MLPGKLAFPDEQLGEGYKETILSGRADLEIYPVGMMLVLEVDDPYFADDVAVGGKGYFTKHFVFGASHW